VSWFNLLTPSAAVLAIFLAIALVIQSFRHGRRIRRLEQQIASAGLTAYDPALERLKAISGLSEKKQRSGTGDDAHAPIASRRTQIIVAAVVGALIVAGVAWAVVSRNSSTAAKRGASAKSTTTTTHRATRTGTTGSTTTHAVTASCATAAPVASPSSVNVAVYNGSGVPGAAGNVIGPKLTSVGYSVGTIGNAPSGVSGAAVSSVQYVTRADLDAACSVATALGVAPAHVTALTLMPASQAGNAGVVVLVGRDIASG
jgi:hypothetical protein